MLYSNSATIVRAHATVVLTNLDTAIKTAFEAPDF